MHFSSSRRGGALVGILAGLGILILVIAAAIAGIGMYLATHVRVEESEGRTAVETPLGSLRVNKAARFHPELFGVPVYPGAEQDEDRRKLASIDLELGDGREFTVLTAHYTTADPAGKVAEFYRERLPKWTVMNSVHSRKGRVTRLEFHGNGFRRMVAIHEEDGVTRIALASVGEPAAN
jgi:hypothetical protein